jgi:hypothetical protein
MRIPQNPTDTGPNNLPPGWELELEDIDWNLDPIPDEWRKELFNPNLEKPSD